MLCRCGDRAVVGSRGGTENLADRKWKQSFGARKPALEKSRSTVDKSIFGALCSDSISAFSCVAAAVSQTFFTVCWSKVWANAETEVKKQLLARKRSLENDAQVRRRYCRFILELLAPIFDGVFSFVKQNNWCFHRKLIFRQLHSCQLLDSLLTEVSWSCFSLSPSYYFISFFFSSGSDTHTHAHSLRYTRTHCRTLSITLTCICSNTAMPPSLQDCLSPSSCTAPAQIHTYTRAWNFSYTPGPQKSNSTAWLECVAHYNAGRLCIDTSWDRWFVKISVLLFIKFL